jgi:restriction system protein
LAIFLILFVVLSVRLFFEYWLPDLISSIKLRLRFRTGEKLRNDRELLRWLRGMHPTQFEQYIADLFRRLGYAAEVVGASHDGGIDVIAEKSGIKHYIQCKKYIVQRVGSGAIRDFYGAIADRESGKGFFITTNTFTFEAEKFAEDKPIELIDGFALVRYIRLAEKETGINLPGIPPRPVAVRMCPKCGGKLIERRGKYGPFVGCSTYPACEYTEKE